MKLTFLRLFDDSLPKYLIFKRISRIQWLFWVIYQVKNRLTSGAHFLHDFPKKDVPYLMLYQWTKFHCHTFFPSGDIKQKVL